MAYVPGYLSDIFISFAHRDDLAAAGIGWVTQFHERLRIAVSAELGADADVWRDPNPGGATVFTRSWSAASAVRRAARYHLAQLREFQLVPLGIGELRSLVRAARQSRPPHHATVQPLIRRMQIAWLQLEANA